MRLKDDKTKEYVVELDNSGNSHIEIAGITGIPRSTIGDFLRQESYTDWWGGDEGVKEVEAIAEDCTKTEQFIYNVVTTKHNPRDTSEKTHLVIPDTQCKPDIDMSYLDWAGKYIIDRKPDVIIHIGDHADMPSLSSYDKGKKKAEGKRVGKDIEASIAGMNRLLEPLCFLQAEELEMYGEVRYKPIMIITLGNHENRIMRHVEANPELAGFLSYDNLRYQDMGWEVHDFLKPVTVDGVSYVHYMANPMSGKPYGGMAMNVLKNVGESFTQGHKQTLDIATRFLPASGKQQWAIIAGAYYEHDEDYKGYQGNHHWRGLIVKHNVKDGSYNPLFVNIEYLKNRYD
jgi:hypothetical protein